MKLNWNFQRVECSNKNTFQGRGGGGGVWIFSGATQSVVISTSF